MELTPIPGATPRYDDDGREIIDIVTCGTCGRSWNDAASSSLTPAPAGRCPFEYDHAEHDARPASYREDNMIGNLIGVIADRSGLSVGAVIATLTAHYGAGDFDRAEGAIWDSYFGPLADSVMDDAGIDWA